MSKTICLSLFCLLALLVSCQMEVKEEISFTPTYSTYSKDTSVVEIVPIKNETRYGILTPLEICDIFERLNIQYSTNVLNPTSNESSYLSNSQAAINTGVYGVDFGYLKMFGVGQEVIDYMLSIRDLSSKLGIPENLLLESIKNIDNNMTDADSIAAIMASTYNDIETHLRQSGRESTAGLMIMGGWIEAMYIATQLAYDPLNPDPVVIQRIAEQKYTLTSLLSFMKNYYDDPVVVFYTKKLKYLKNYFDKFEIYFDQNDLEIDTTKQVLRSSGANMTITEENLNDIRLYIAKLRNEIVSI